MKNFLKLLLFLLILILVKLLFSFTVNEIMIVNYDNDKYNENLINTLYFINFPESYIAYYNHGNILYKTENYEEAISKFETALEKNPSQNRVCDIRVNLSLSIIATIDNSKQNDSLSKLKKARIILYEDNCANEFDNNGKDEKAEKLEEEIKKLEKELESSNQNNEDDNPQDNNKDYDNEKEQTVEEKLREIQRGAASSRQHQNDYDENRQTYYDGKNW